MSITFTAEALGDYLCIGIDGVRLLINSSFISMNPNALTEKDINTLFDKNPKLLGNLDEFISWYYLDYSVDKDEAAHKRYALVQDRNWRLVTGYEVY
jgi:hypothetical protein